MAFHHRKLMLAGPDEKPGSHPANHPIPNLLVLFLGIAGAAFLFLSYFAMRRFASRRRSSPPLVNGVREEDFADGPVIDHPIWHIRTVGYPQSVVDSIQTVTYRKGEGLIETSDCSVCLSELEEGENLRLLPKCSHAFHVACIDTWLRSHTNCPLCRAPIVAVQSSPLESSGESERGGVEDDGAVQVFHEEEEMEAVRRSVSMDFSSISIAEPKNPVSIKRSVSLSLYA